MKILCEEIFFKCKIKIRKKPVKDKEEEVLRIIIRFK